MNFDKRPNILFFSLTQDYIWLNGDLQYVPGWNSFPGGCIRHHLHPGDKCSGCNNSKLRVNTSDTFLNYMYYMYFSHTFMYWNWYQIYRWSSTDSHQVVKHVVDYSIIMTYCTHSCCWSLLSQYQLKWLTCIYDLHFKWVWALTIWS